ncbi:putative serine protease K12H4.7 [Ischnura elegans]|uniref:putative serine protease K12H4.7 n=1 Tax=Ischnura elegans TaxID=197161 RepID=UPI001ED8B0DE|nr:putative serine protease K12H4.7 [Ischnura elegans]
MKKLTFLLPFLASALCFATGWKLSKKARYHGGLLGEPVMDRNFSLPPDQYFSQKLDHFNPTDVRTWKQRYFTNDTFYYAGGPVFLMIGGEGTASPKWMVTGQWIELAMIYGAMCFQLEHRYYGKSHPTPDSSVKNLVYLSSEQALADLANFIENMNNAKNLTGSKWIVFGGSYPGSLAAWMRIKYPHLVHGAVSSSGPLLAKSNFKEYMEVVRASLATHSEKCVSQVERAIKQITTVIEEDEVEADLDKLFKLCDPLEPSNDPNDISNFFESLASNWAGIVQYNKDNREFEGAKGTNITIDVACDLMTSGSGKHPIHRYADLNAMLLEAYGEKCMDYKYSKMIKNMRDTSWKDEEAAAARLWTYQTCTEFGFFQTSNATDQPFGDDFQENFFQQQCVDIFGAKFNADFLKAAIRRTNMFYGGYDIEISRVIFVHGSIDPWHALGITHSLSEEAQAILINGTAHCADMYPGSDRDPPQLVEARQRIMETIGKWLE